MKPLRIMQLLFGTTCLPLIGMLVTVSALPSPGRCAEQTKSDNSSAPSVKEVTVRGSGIDVESAKKDAYREAVRQVVGLYTTESTRVENDELIEDKVISLSSGLVEKAETLKESNRDGLIQVSMKCWVRVTKVVDTLSQNNVATTKIEEGTIKPVIDTIDDQERAREELKAAAFEGFPSAWFKVEADEKVRIGEKAENGDRKIYVTTTVKPDLDAYKASAAKLAKALEVQAKEKWEFDVDGARCGFSDKYAKDNCAEWFRRVVSPPLEDNCGVEALACIELSVGMPPAIRDMYFSDSKFCFPTEFYGNGRRSHWVCFRLEQKTVTELEKTYGAADLALKTALRDKNGQPIAVNDLIISNNKWGGRRLGVYNTGITPAWRLQDSRDTLVSVWKFEQMFLLGSEEAGSVASVDVSLSSMKAAR